MRQGGQDPKQLAFRDLLLRLRDGNSTEADYQLLMSRTRERAENFHLFDEALRLFPKNELVKEYNLKHILAMQQPIGKIDALHTGTGASKALSQEAGGLQRVIYLCKGAQVMLSTNLCVIHGLVNGAIGHVNEVIYAPGSSPPSLPVCINVTFKGYTGPTLENGAIPICPVSFTYEYGTAMCTRLQVPLKLAWAVSIHKSQGMTLDRVVLDIGDSEFSPGLSYVAMSRVRAIDDILFESPFPSSRLHKSSEKAHKKRVGEEERLCKMALQGVSSMNCGTFPIPVELPRKRKIKENKPIMNKIPSINNVSPALKVPTSNSHNPTIPSYYKITHQTQNSIIMNPSTFSYNPIDVGWQHLVCADLGLDYIMPNGCLPGEPTQPLTTPATSFNILGDGACFFRCLSYVTTGSQEQHFVLRQKVCDHMLIPDVSQWLRSRGYSDVDIQTVGMRETSTWATDTQIFAASDLLRTQILTAHSQSCAWMLFNPRGRGLAQFVGGEFSIYINYIPSNGVVDSNSDHYEVVRSIM